VKETGLYQSRLLPEARAIVDIHWTNRVAVMQHWKSVIEDGSPNPVIERQRG
jgi:hypothetical protein